MPQKTLSYEGKEETSCGYTAGSNEERFESTGADIRNVRDVSLLGDISRPPGSEVDDKHGKYRAKPDSRCNERDPDILPVIVAKRYSGHGS